MGKGTSQLTGGAIMIWLIIILYIIISIIYSLVPYTVQVILDKIFLVSIIVLVIKFGVFLHKSFELEVRLKIWGYILFVIIVAFGSVFGLYFIYMLALSKV